MFADRAGTSALKARQAGATDGTGSDFAAGSRLFSRAGGVLRRPCASCGSRRRDLVQRERQVDAAIERHGDGFGAVAVELEPQLGTPPPLGQVSRNGVMPMTAPSFSRTTRAPGGSDTIAAVTFAGAVVAGGAGRRRRVRGRRRCDGHRVGGPGLPRPARQPQRDAARSPALPARSTGALRPARSGRITSVARSRACAACVNVVGIAAGPACCGRAVGAVGRPPAWAARSAPRARRPSSACVRRAPWLEAPEDQPLQIFGDRRRRSSAAAAAAALMCRWTISPKPSDTNGGRPHSIS